MGADLSIHIVTDNITEDHFKCFFKNSLGSKYFFNDFVCEWEEKKEKDYERAWKILEKEFPNYNTGPLYKDKEMWDRWTELYSDHIMRVGYICSHYEEISNTPSIWIGEVSWLKAAFLEDADTFVPNTIMRITEIIGEDLPIIDDELIEKINLAFQLENNTKKEGGVFNGEGYDLASWEEVKEFLEQYKGYKCFTVS